MATKTSIKKAATETRNAASRVTNVIENYERTRDSGPRNPGLERLLLEQILSTARDTIRKAEALQDEALEYRQEAI